MRTLIQKIIMLTLLFSIVACTNELEEKLLFDFETINTNASFSADTLIVRKSETIGFKFKGNADIISFFSGENSREYSKRNQTEVPANEIVSKLKFAAMPQYGIIPGTLRVFVSTDFNGLLLNNKQADSILIKNHNWEEITDLCNLSSTSGLSNNTEVDLQKYLGKRLSIAFLYKTEQNSATQPTWIIKDLRIENTHVKNGVSLIKASNVGFAAFDMLHLTTPYNKNGGSGVWDLRNVAATTDPNIRMQSSASGQALNEDWLISSPTLINSRMPDTGVAVKDLPNNVIGYAYAYNKVGVYELTFVGVKTNFSSQQEISKSIVVKVVE